MTVPGECWDVDELRGQRRKIPAGPGVYVFVGGDGVPVYVGKSVNLRSRLASYLGSGDRRRKESRIAQAAESVHLEPAGSEFAALLRELELIQRFRPRLNRRMKSPQRYVFVGLSYAAEFPSVSVSNECEDEARRYLGPFVQRRRIEKVVEDLNDAFALRTCEPLADEVCWRGQMRRCSQPCIGAVSAGEYGRSLLLVREALAGRRSSALKRLREVRNQHSQAERFEAAGRAQQRIEVLERIGKVLYASALHDGDALIALPAVEPGVVDAWAVRGGGIVASRRLSGDEAAAPYLDLRRAMASAAPVSPVAKQEVDQRCIVHAWLRRHRDEPGVVPVQGKREAEIRDDFAAAVSDALRAQGMLAAPRPEPAAAQPTA